MSTGVKKHFLLYFLGLNTLKYIVAVNILQAISQYMPVLVGAEHPLIWVQATAKSQRDLFIKKHGK